MKEIISKELGEKYYVVDHESGLHIIVSPKKDYKSTYALFGTKYGSINNCFRENEDGPVIKVPEGIAHFLEHKLFESKEVDAFERFSKTGGSANAYTSFDRTCYLFDCSDRFEDNLRILLDFVTHPYFTAETVKKEQGIIGQEIRMYYDMPEWMSSFGLLRCLYQKHPIRIDIAGTTESIAKIDDKLLYKCYNTFYNLHNMALVVVGNVDVDTVVSICDEMLKKSDKFEAVSIFEDEPDDIAKEYEEYNLDIAMPYFAFGYKEKCETPMPTLKRYCAINIILDILIGGMSPLYTELLKDGLINGEFAKEYSFGYGYESTVFEGQSKDPQQVMARIKKEIANLRKNGIDEEIFESVRRQMYGNEIMAYNDIEELGNMYITDYFYGYDPYEIIDTYKNLNIKDVEECLQTIFRDDKCALSVVKKSE